MSITGYIPTLEAQFTFHDSNSPAATQWGYQFVAYLQKNGTTSKTRYPQGRIDASALTDGSTQTVRFPGVTPGTSYDGFVALADGQGNETPQVPLFTNYAVPKVASGDPVGPIWGKLHHLPIETDPTNGTWNTGTGTFDRTAHHPDITSTVNTGGGIDFSYNKHTNKTLDNVADGTRKAVTAIDANGKALIDFNSAHVNQGALSKKNSVDLSTTDVVNKTASNITYTGGATVDSLKPAEAGAEQTTGKSIDILVDGTHRRVAASAFNGSSNTQFGHGAMSPGVQAGLDASGNSLNVEFSGGKLQANGSLTNVDGATGHTALPFSAGSIIHVEGIISAGSTSNATGLLLGNLTEGYYVTLQPGNVFELVRYHTGTGTVLQSTTVGNDTAKHRYQLTVTLGTSDTIEASIDGIVLPVSTDATTPNIANPATVTVYTGGGSGSLSQYTFTVGIGHYGTLPSPVKGVINPDGSAGKTTDWLPESSTNKYAAEHGADITANHNSAGTGSGASARSAANLAAIVGTDNAIPSSGPWKAHIPNSLANLISNITVHTYSASPGALSMWFTSTSNSSSPGGSTYPAWTYPDGSGGIYPGHTNGYAYVNGTSQTAAAENNAFQWTGLGSGGVYVGVKYDIASDAYSIIYGPSSTAPTDAQIASVAGDGSICAVIASATTNSVIATGGGGGSSFTGGGGRQRQ